METENNQSTLLHHAAMKNLTDSRRRCDRRKILENEDNYFFNDLKGNTIQDHELSFEKNEEYDTDDSSKSSIVLQQKHRKILRRCKIWRRRNIKELKDDVTKRKNEEKMLIKRPVIEKIEENEFLLGEMIETVVNSLEGMSLVFTQNEAEYKWNNEKVTQTLLFKIKQSLDQINEQFLEIYEKWERTIQKEDSQEMKEDFLVLKEQTLNISKKKDLVINELFEKLKEIPTKLLYEELNNSDDLHKLNEIADEKIKFLKEEHEKCNLNIIKLIEDERNKNINIDSTKWKLMINEIINRISNSAINQYSLIEKNAQKLIDHIDKTNSFREQNCGKSMIIDADFELFKIKCKENTEKLQHNLKLLKKATEENVKFVADQKRQIALIREFLTDRQEKFNSIDSENKVQISIIKKEIMSTNKRIDEQKKKDRLVEKNANDLFLKIWDQQQKDIMHSINNVREIDDFIHKFLNINKEPDMSEESVTDELLRMNKNNNLLLDNYPNKNSISKSYNRLRDNALDQLLLDYILKNSSVVIDYNLHEIIDPKFTQSFPYAYNTLSALRLNTEIWNLLKSKCKQFVTCVVCNTRVSWEINETIENSNNDFEEKCCNDIISDTKCTTESKRSKSLLEKLCNLKNPYNESIDKVKKSDFSVLPCTPNYANYSDSTIKSIDEKQSNINYSTEVVDNNTPISYGECKNINHQLSTIDDKYFIPIIEVIIKENESKTVLKKSTPSNEYSCTWQMSKKDIQEYWTQFKKYIPNSINDWNCFHVKIEYYKDLLVAYQKSLSKTRKLKNENKKLKQIKYQLNQICLVKNITM